MGVSTTLISRPSCVNIIGTVERELEFAHSLSVVLLVSNIGTVEREWELAHHLSVIFLVSTIETVVR